MRGPLRRAELGQGSYPGRGQPVQQGRQYRRGGPGVGQGAMAGRVGRPEEIRQGGELAVRHLVLGEQQPGQRDRVQYRRRRPAPPGSGARRAEKADVEGGVVRGEHAPAGEVEEARQHRADRGSEVDHGIGDAGQGDDVGRDQPARVDQGGELAADLPAAQPDRADLGDAVPVG